MATEKESIQMTNDINKFARLSIFAITSVLFTASVSADQSIIEFSPIKSYVKHGVINTAHSYGVTDKYIVVPGRGGIVSDFPLDLRSGISIEFSVKSSIDITDKGWVQQLRLFLFEEQPIQSLKGARKNGKYIQFTLLPETVQRPNYTKEKSNTVHSSGYPAIWESNNNYLAPLKWNEITISVLNENQITVLVNNKVALIYKGSHPLRAYLGIGQNYSKKFFIGKHISINGQEKTIGLEFEQ